jgi:DNA modification methylase
MTGISVASSAEMISNENQTIESGTCRRCDARLVMLGWEDSVEEYVAHVVLAFDEIKRVLKSTGVFWLNIADNYLDKHLRLIPQRMSIALAEAGWICRQEVIWHITTKVPESTTDRLYRNHEQVFIFTKKEKDYYFDGAAIRERPAHPGKLHRVSRRAPSQGTARTWHRPRGGLATDGMRNRRTVWSIPNEPSVGGHPSPFPKALVEPMVLSSCPPGGVCLDPFAGTGTVGLVALADGRRAILIEANPEYCGVAKHRVGTELEPYKAELEEHRRQEREARLLTPTSDIIVQDAVPAAAASGPNEDANAERIG